MASSMTGFARREQRDALGYAAWEGRSLNHRFLEISVHLPKELTGLEHRCRKLIGSRIQRGKLSFQLYLEVPEAPSASFTLNQKLLGSVLEATEQVRRLLKNPAPIDPLAVLRWPDVYEPTAPALEQWSDPLLRLLEQCLDDLSADRRREGETLARGLGERCDAIAKLLSLLRREAPTLARQAKRKLQEQALQLQEKLAPERLEQELVILMQKSDIEEELDRLEFYLDEVRRLLLEDRPVGKHLNFLMQELHREINTISSKLTFAGGEGSLIQLKVLTEQMREQVQNIE